MESRPDPNALLALTSGEGGTTKRGRLKIFFGYAAGVGKTYAMLQNAKLAKSAGKDVVLGYIEPHARPNTQALMIGFESIPCRLIDYRSVAIREFDIDAAVKRHPQILLVDELAHTNAEGSRHAKRWQDIDELLEAGIDVWTTLNVQHLDSLNDIVGQITGVAVRETLPDHVFESANEIELVDLPPDDLIDRLNQGHVYLPAQAQKALQSFFHKSNLHALREISLRQAASRIHSDVEVARKSQSSSATWATSERLLVCVGPSPTTAKVIRTAKRMAIALNAPWMAVSVELPDVAVREAAKARIAEHFNLAERLGAETITLAGSSVVNTILEYAKHRNVTKIFVGKTNVSKWKRYFAGSLVDHLIESSKAIDVYVIHGETEKISTFHRNRSRLSLDSLGAFAAIFATCISGGIAAILRTVRIADSEANTVMIFLASVALIAFRFGTSAAILASVLAVLVFDFFFVPPYLTFAISDTQYLVTFVIMLAIGFLISTLASRLKTQIENSRKREHRTNALYELGKQLSSVYGEVFLINTAAQRISEMLSSEVAVFLKRPKGQVEQTYGNIVDPQSVSVAAAQWTIEHQQISGRGTNTLPNADSLFIPLQGSQTCLGCLALINDEDPAQLLQPDSRRLIDTCASQLALALERDQMAINASDSKLQAETERLRNTLLASVSHDLKTPLASIAGSSSVLLRSKSMDPITHDQLLESIFREANRLNRVLSNIMQMTRLEAGASNPNFKWHLIEEIMGSALHRTSDDLTGHRIETNIQPDLPLVLVDDVLLEQVFINLLDNAAKYTPQNSLIRLDCRAENEQVRISIRDYGPGIPQGMEERIFEKFYRANAAPDSGGGNGLGLAICRAIITILGGSITASNPSGGGAEFVILLPKQKMLPEFETG